MKVNSAHKGLEGISIPGFDVIKKLGKNKNFTTLLVRQANLGRKVVLKLLNCEFGSETGSVSQFERSAEELALIGRFQREGQIMARVGHPNIAAIFDIGTATDGRPYIAREYIDGPSLSDILIRHGKINIADAQSILSQLASALTEAHQSYIAHGNIKPENILFDASSDRFVLTDFSYDKSNSDASYASPEQLLGESVTGKSDIYTLGLVVIRALTYDSPSTSSAEVTNSSQKKSLTNNLEVLRTDIPDDLAYVLHQCMADNPVLRPSSEVLATLSQNVQAQPDSQLIDAIHIDYAGKSARVEMHFGDLSEIRQHDAVDVLVVSAFSGNYIPARNSLIGALHKKGLSIAQLAEKKDVDLRDAFCCWMSSEIPRASSDLNFRRVLCFEPAYQNVNAIEAIGDIFRSVAPFIGADDSIKSMAMPVVATGVQGYQFEEVLPELINTAVHWITAGLPLEVIKIYTNNKSNAKRAEEIFSIIKRKLQRDSMQANGFEYDVFISYSHKDLEAARLLSQQFKKENLSFFIDELELNKGVAWQQHIFEALDKSRVVLALYSPSYIKSKVCQEEFNIAWARNRNADHEVIFPVYWSRANLPTYMDMLNYVDCRENDVNSLAVACDGLIEKLKLS